MPSRKSRRTPRDRQDAQIARAFGQMLAAALGVPVDQLLTAATASREPDALDAALGVQPGSVAAAAQGLATVARAWHSSRGGAAE